MNCRKQSLQIFAVERSVFKRHWELNEKGSQAPFVGDGVKAFAGADLVFVSGPDTRGRCGLHQ